jgi:hypothetical protein
VIFSPPVAAVAAVLPTHRPGHGKVSFWAAVILGSAALYIAICKGHLDAVHVVLGWQARIDADNRWARAVIKFSFKFGHVVR